MGLTAVAICSRSTCQLFALANSSAKPFLASDVCGVKRIWALRD